jgi:hypothetical protein
MHRYEVRLAIAKNPHAPLDVAGRMVLTLLQPDLYEVVADDALDALLRGVAQQKLDYLKPAG